MLTRTLTAIVLVAAMALGGCGSDSDRNASGSDGPGVIDGTGGGLGDGPGDGTDSGAVGGPCFTPTDVELVVQAQTPDEVEYLDQIDACTDADGTQTWLNNRSDLVWVPTVDGGADVTGLSTTARTFGTAVRHPNALLVPDDNLTVQVSPNLVEWRFDLGLSVAWEARDVLLGWAVANGLKAAFENPRSRVAAAVTTCLLAVRTAAAAQEGAVVDGQVQPSAIITGTIGVGASAVVCNDRLRGAAAVSNFEAPSVALAQKASLLEEADSILSKAARIQRLGNILAKIR